jgi:hypothetical protein
MNGFAYFRALNGHEILSTLGQLLVGCSILGAPLGRVDHGAAGFPERRWASLQRLGTINHNQVPGGHAEELNGSRALAPEHIQPGSYSSWCQLGLVMPMPKRADEICDHLSCFCPRGWIALDLC